MAATRKRYPVDLFTSLVTRIAAEGSLTLHYPSASRAYNLRIDFTRWRCSIETSTLDADWLKLLNSVVISITKLPDGGATVHIHRRDDTDTFAPLAAALAASPPAAKSAPRQRRSIEPADVPDESLFDIPTDQPSEPTAEPTAEPS